MQVAEAVASRRSVRAYLDRPVDPAVLRRVLEQAQWSPSGCNLQPWQAAVLMGKPLEDLRALLKDHAFQSPPEYPITPDPLTDPWRGRYGKVTGARLAAEGVARGDEAAREASAARNYEFFGAPALLLCWLPRHMNAPQWSDMGMWLQTIMLLLRGEGLDSCALESLSRHARTIKDYLGVSDTENVFFCGMAIGWRDPDAAINQFERQRAPLEESVRFVGFEETTPA